MGKSKSKASADNSRLPEGGVLSEDDVRAAAVTDESVLDDGGVYAVLILMGIYVGETGVFGPRFSQHACALDNGNDKLVKAKTVAKKTGAPVEELVLLPLPVRTTPGAVRHVFETLINVRCQATAPKNLNSNVWDTSFYRRPERISGKELKAFLVAVKKYVDGGGLLPKKGDPEWVRLFGGAFNHPTTSNHMSSLISEHERPIDIRFYKDQIGLQLKINDWAGRARMPKKAKPERAHKRAAEMRASLDSKFESKEDEDNYFVQFGIGKKRRGLR